MSPENVLLVRLLAYTLAAALFIYVWGTHALAEPATRTKARTHLVAHARHHVVMVLLVLAGLGAGGFVTYRLLHHGGAIFNPRIHITAPRRHVLGGGHMSATVADLSAPLRAKGEQIDQGPSLACCSIATVRLDELARWYRGETRLPLPLSPYRPYWWLTGGNLYAPSSPVDDAAAYTAHGAEPLAHWPLHGYPAADDPLYTVDPGATTIAWDAYNESGIGAAGAADALYWLGQGRAVGLLWDVHTDGDSALGQLYTWDGGPHAYYHCLPIVGYTPDLPELGGPAFLVWNSYGTAYGRAGLIWLPEAVLEHHGVGLFVEHPGPPVQAWLPTPTPPAPPLATPIPRGITSTPTPTKTPVPPTKRPAAPTKTPPAPSRAYWAVYVLSHASNMRAAPRTTAPIMRGLPRGALLRSLGWASTHWLFITEHGTPGYVWRAFAERTPR